MERLSGRVAVVTGAGSGIGLALAEALGSEGAEVVLADLDPVRLDEAVARVEAAGAPAAIAVPTDVADAAAVDELARRALEAFGAVNVVCNNAGVSALGNVWQTPLEDWRWVLDVNLMGVVHGIRAFLPILLEQDEAHVVNTASAAAVLTTPGMGAYIAAKHAVVGVSKALRADLASRWPHVGVTVVCPGGVATNLADNVRTLGRPHDEDKVGALRASLVDATPPGEVATAIVAAIRERRFWLLPNAEGMVDAIAAEMDELRAACDRAARPGAPHRHDP